MDAEVANGTFRNDLYFRLNVMSLKLPPLAERPLDIQILSEYFIKKFSKANGLLVKNLNPEALQTLKNHRWPGNVRELENAIHRAVLLANEKEITKDAIMLSSNEDSILYENEETQIESNNQGLVGQTVANVERGLIIDTLLHCIGNRTHAANILGISIRTLRNKLKQYTC